MFFGSFPFDGESGMPGGRMPGRRQEREIDNKRMYEALELTRECSAADLKKAYRKLAIKHHPDKGGDSEKFKEIGRAYEILSDPEKRKIYDAHGEAGLDGQGGGGADPTDIFDLFFGGGRKARQSQSKKKGEDVVTRLKVTLEQLYNGATRKLAISKDAVCPDCGGVGGPESAMEQCGGCNGQGIRIQVRQIGPMIQQSQAICQNCRGNGRFMPDKKKCKKCSGEGTIKERKILEVSIDKGMIHNQKIVFQGEADQRPGEVPGDVIFILEQEDHPCFKRNGSDLIYKHTINLYEALLGYEFKLTQLDKREIVVRATQNQITKPGDIRAVADEGMPTHRNPFIKGTLLILMDVLFPLPKQLDANIKDKLANLLPKPSRIQVNEKDPNVEIHYAEPVDAADLMRRQQNEKDKDATHEDSDDEHHGPASGVQCRQQ